MTKKPPAIFHFHADQVRASYRLNDVSLFEEMLVEHRPGEGIVQVTLAGTIVKIHAVPVGYQKPKEEKTIVKVDKSSAEPGLFMTPLRAKDWETKDKDAP